MTWSRSTVLVVWCVLTACSAHEGPADGSIGSSPVTCDHLGAAGGGTLVDEAGAMHSGPAVSVTWQPAGSAPGSITLDAGDTTITLFGVSCSDSSGGCPPPVGEYKDTSYTSSFHAPWLMGSVEPDTLDVIVDVSAPTDLCWGGRYDIVYGFDRGGVEGELKGWWVNP